MEPIIEFEHVRKSYGEKTVLGDFSLAVAPGDFVTIVGASGGGKTTVLKMVNGLLTPDSGTIRVMGRDIREMDHPAAPQHWLRHPGQRALSTHDRRREHRLRAKSAQ